VLEELCQLDERLAGARLPRLVIHGDYGLHNILFQPDGTVIPTDFELARLEWRLSDLVLLIPRFRDDGLRCFMAAYQAEFPLSSDEWHFLPDVWKFRKLQGAVQAWSTYFESGGASHKLLSARKNIDQANWALDNRDRLIDLMG
jgi:Ser/Thr protein kinase RdoA (MazF antagonist)